MKEAGAMPIGWRPVLAHAATVGVTLMLVVVLFGDRLGLRRPPLAQIRGRAVPPAPRPMAPLTQAADGLPGRPAASSAVPPPPEDVLAGLDPDERNNIRVYSAVNRSVVNITTEAEGAGFFGDETSTGGGSGFVIDKNGHVLTNFHVIEDADSVRVKLFDGSAHEAKVVGADVANDVAVLKVQVPADKLAPVKFGDSSKVLVGQKILALGNPFGLERTLTAGIVSSLDRSFRAKNGRTIKGIIQTDAAINPGNSGGPLLNSRGEVIGMNTAIVSQVGQSAGISFAVPINGIARILEPLVRDGRVIRADLGIKRYYATGEGLLIVSLVDGGPAQRAGLLGVRVRVERIGPGFVRRTVDPDSADLIVAVEHKRVRTLDDLLTEVENHRPGQTIRVTVVRDGQPIDIAVLLGQS